MSNQTPDSSAPPLWPRCEIELANGRVVVLFGPKTLASIERESGMSSMQFAEKFSDPKTAPIFDVGLKIILGAVKASIPGMTEDLLSERIIPGTFLPIVQQIAEKWGEAVGMSASPIEAVDAPADPPKVGAASPSST
jgi:hypothetical protein